MSDVQKTQVSFARKAVAEPDHRFGDLYHLICRDEWLEEALWAVLRNIGSRTPGVDGMTRSHLKDEQAQYDFIHELRGELRGGIYRPQPVRRLWIAKDNGQQRPLGIPTIKDRVVQRALKMLLEPIWESDFLNCSNGFRPGRRTMDCIRLCRSRITTQNKFFWIVEGDIKGCFDHVHHEILLGLVERRVRDRRIIGLIDAMLKAGVMEKRLFQHSEEGTPQGGILSPLLANIYLHEFDKWWWQKYGQLSLYQKARRRRARLGNCILTRYADDFLLLCNGPRAEAERIREEARQVLWDVLRLELSMEKTHLTHATDGFDFLGFHVKFMLPKSGKPSLRVAPSKKNIERFKRTIKAQTRRDTSYQAPLEKIRILNRMMHGWNQYYEYSNATAAARRLTFWANGRFFLWLKKRHKKLARWVIRHYRHRERRGVYDRWNLGVPDEKGNMVFLYQLTDLHRRIYYARTVPHPYLEPVEDSAFDTPFPVFWEGKTTVEKSAWFEMRLEALARDNYRCTQCGSTSNLHVHHVRPKRKRGEDRLDNLSTLCWDCHTTTTPWGRPPGS